MIVRKNGEWLAAHMGDELLMMSAEHGLYLGLSEVGARIWELIETPLSLDALCGRLEAEFEIDEPTCRAEVSAFLAELVRHKAVALSTTDGR